MAPIDIEYGRVLRVGDQEAYSHWDSTEPLTVDAGEKEKIGYKFRTATGDLMELKATATCSDDDAGGSISYEIKQLGTMPNTTLAKGILTIAKGEEKAVQKQHPAEAHKMLSVGFIARHVEPKKK